jgi:aminoglycoside N3'-acetyltransferase
MEKLTQSDLIDALARVNISKGDKLLVHSSSMAFGRPEKGIRTFISALQDAVGPKGVIAAPTFTFRFVGEGQYSYVETASVGMGALNEALRKQEGAIRSNHPIQSVTFLGPVSDEFTQDRPFSAYESGATFDLMAKQGFKILLLGVSPKYISHSHLSEERHQVPYRFMKKVKGNAVFSDSLKPIKSVWGFYARYLDLDAHPEKEDVIVRELLVVNKWHQTSLNGAAIGCGYAQDYVCCLDKKLEVNPYWMLKNQSAAKEYYSTRTTHED